MHSDDCILLCGELDLFEASFDERFGSRVFVQLASILHQNNGIVYDVRFQLWGKLNGLDIVRLGNQRLDLWVTVLWAHHPSDLHSNRFDRRGFIGLCGFLGIRIAANEAQKQDDD